MTHTNVLIVDDTTLMRLLLASQLAGERDMQVLGEAADGREAVDMALRLKPDVILMDADMPFMNGIEATERILSQLPHTRIIILTAHPILANVGKTFGAFACLEKSCTPEDLMTTIRRARQQAPGAQTEPGNRDSYRDTIARLALRAGLTEREQRTLEKAMQTELTIEQVATALTQEYGQTFTLSSVKHSLDRVLTKLRIEPRTRASLIRYVLEFEQTNAGEVSGRQGMYVDLTSGAQ